MDMSTACLPPNQPACTSAEKVHPLHNDYLNYLAAMSRQMVTGATFACWLEQTEKAENGFSTVFEVTSLDASLAMGWYQNTFGAGNKLVRCDGPFKTRAEADSTAS